MKYSASIRYGGQLVDADDCDYEDYKNLQLLCPECKEPVYLQKTSVRNLIHKQVSIPAHFKHFLVKNIEQIQLCENRIKKYDQKEIDKRKRQARNQRFKTLQLHFWQLLLSNCKALKFSHECGDDILTPMGMEKLVAKFLNTGFISFFDPSAFGFKQQDDMFNFVNKHFKGKTLDIQDVHCFKSCMIDDLNNYFLSPSHPKWVKHRQEYSSKANVNLAHSILLEISDFICAKSSRNLRLNCVAFGILRCTASDGDPPRWFAECLEKKIDLWRVALSSFAMELIQIDWVKALSELEKYV